MKCCMMMMGLSAPTFLSSLGAFEILALAVVVPLSVALFLFQDKLVNRVIVFVLAISGIYGAETWWSTADQPEKSARRWRPASISVSGNGNIESSRRRSSRCPKVKSPWSLPLTGWQSRRNGFWARWSIATTSRTRESFSSTVARRARQVGILTAGTYRINTAQFAVITSVDAGEHGMYPELLRLHRVEPDQVGIVTTLDGRPIEAGEIAGPAIPGHDNFQNAQSFLDGGGRRGLQEQILLSGTWNLNPWFVQVQQVPMVQIPIGYVGVVISYVGMAHEDVSGVDFKHGDLVNAGHKGVWVTPLYPGKHPVNTFVMKVELVPTTNIVLNWASRTESHNYDAKLSSITVRSRDGFAFNLDVSQIIHVGALDAPKVISRVGSMQNLVDHVLQPIVGNYFRNSAQDYTVLDFLSARSQRQVEAAEHIRAALQAYDVQAIDTLIGDINPPAELMQTQTDRKIAEERRKTYEVQEAAQKQRQQLVRQTSLADIQQQVVDAEQGVSIAELHANSHIKQATGEAEAVRLRALGEAEAIRATGQAKAEAYRVGVEALGAQGYTVMQLMQIVGERNVRIVPDVAVSGANGNTGLVDGLLGVMLRNQTNGKAGTKDN